VQKSILSTYTFIAKKGLIEMKMPEPHSMNFTSLISDIERGHIKIPQFQRDFVWKLDKAANLIDSIIKGYPIGTFIFWKTKERLRTVKNIGRLILVDPPEGDFVDFVLDGQQRLTSLFASLKGVKILRVNGAEDDFSEMYIDLDAKEDEQIVVLDITDKHKQSFIKVTDLLYGGIPLLASYPEKYLEKLGEFKKRIEIYHFSTILLKEVSLDVATEVFTRINVTGEQLSLFQIMVAKTFDSKRNFDLTEKYDMLIDRLTPLEYDTISDATVLQVISIILEGDCTRKQILKLDKKKFIDIWDVATDSIERAIEYFRGFYRIPVSHLLPYNALVVPFSYFFYKHKNKPTGEMQKYLQDFFWRCSLSERYSSGVESKLAQDIKRIDEILNQNLPKYDWTVDTSPKAVIENGWFSAGRSYVKAILCLYAYKQPKSFNDNSIVHIRNYWLKQANSVNYHHFFPKAFLKKRGEDDFSINHILNITIVDDYLNKNEIGAKAPSLYMKKFSKTNVEIAETMKTHFINNVENYGIYDDNYELFFRKRSVAVSNEIKKRVIIT
jgi:hypothetical protein